MKPWTSKLTLTGIIIFFGMELSYIIVCSTYWQVYQQTLLIHHNLLQSAHVSTMHVYSLKNESQFKQYLKITLIKPCVSQPSSFSISCFTDRITGPSFSSSEIKFKCSYNINTFMRIQSTFSCCWSLPLHFSIIFL